MRYGRPNIPAVDPKVIMSIINSGWVSIGKYTERLEEHFREKFSVKHAIGCCNATTGLTIAVKACGWSNLLVAMPAFTWPSTVYAIGDNTPVWQDIDPETWLMTLGDGIYDYVMAMDTFGSSAPKYRETDRPIIYDAAHSYGSPDLGHRGIVEVVSLSFTKIITAMEGGMILTQDDVVAETARELRRLSGRMGEINAYIALQSIDYYEKTFKYMQLEILEKYKRGFDFAYNEQIIPRFSNGSVYAIKLERPSVQNSVIAHLAKESIECKVYYEPLMDGLPNTDQLYSRIVALPVHSDMVDEQDRIIEVMNRAVANSGTPGKQYMKNAGYFG